MKRISLISNTSIQYYRYESEIDLDFGKQNKLYFIQPFDTQILKFTFENLVKVNNDGYESFYKKKELAEKDLLINDSIKDGADLSQCHEVKEEIYDVNNLRSVLKKFRNKWIPLPYFKNNNINRNVFAPVDWVRCFFECDDDFKSIKIVLAIDTTLTESNEDIASPKLSLNPDENIFKIDTSDGMIDNFLFNNHYQTEWIEEYIADIYFGKNDSQRYEQPIKGYIGNYILLLKFLKSLKTTPEIQLFTDDSKKIPVDLVVDLGNSATCALLFENSNDEGFSFDKVKKLIINDFSSPLISYDEPFPMNLVFSESNFGEIKREKYHHIKFSSPSFVRIGNEAKRLIDSSVIELSLGRELQMFNSSPKRYLWDVNPTKNEWDYFPTDLSKVKKVYLNGLSEQLKANGQIAKDGMFGSQALYSRNSLMKFVFLEILNHAFVQINSFDFRSEHGNLTMPRFLKRITISCPTAMIQNEQIALREAAIDACTLLNNFIKLSNKSSNSSKNWFEIPEINPSIVDLNKNLSELEDRKDWNYDEATVSQLVFAYSLFSQKLNAHQYTFNNVLLNGKNDITIASIDIGAGTTDVMVCNHSLKVNNGVVIKPKPIFWESFKIAGDDMLKEIIQQIVIEGVAKNDLEIGCTGVIENYARAIGIENIGEKLNGFFGQDSNNIGYVAKMMRKSFIHQVAIPISKFYLEKANEKYDEYHTTLDIIGHTFNNEELVKYFKRHFGFDFLDLKWRVNSKKVNEIVEAVFGNLIEQISLVLNECKCDFIVLSGRPCSLVTLENLFVNSLVVDPTKVINLNHYWIGKWFPFADNKGFVSNPKTIVSVGAIVALMAGKLNKLGDFKIDTEFLRQNTYSTADNIVISNFSKLDVVLTKKKSESTILINKIPTQLGYSKVVSKNYPITQLYSLGFNDSDLITNFKSRFPNNTENYYQDLVSKFKSDIIQKMPLKVSLSRDTDFSKEKILIESIEDNEGNDLPVKSLKLNYQSISDENGYWLDTCEFVLNARG